ncbi:MAG: type IV pilus secretin PilQ [Deltaproteobacteria bacterium]|nr:type IV pilus secretin PilQ [Deltaproteobacteria bacterium]
MAFKTKLIQTSICAFFVASFTPTWAADLTRQPAQSLEESAIARVPDTPISLDLRDADIKPLLRALGEQSKLNLLVHEDVKGQITLTLRNVPLREALQGIARANGLLLIPGPGDIIEILPLQSYQARLQQFAAIAPAPTVEVPPPLVTQKVEIRYAFNPRDSISAVGREVNVSGRQIKDLTELADLLRKRLSGRPGSDVSAISRLNALVITDVPQKVEEIVAVIQTIDVPNETVGIEARIVEVTTQALKDLGVQWGGRIRFGDAAFQGGGLGSTSGTPPTAPQSGAVGLSGNNFIVNLPADIPLTGPGGSFGFTLGRTASRVLDVQISALEQQGKLRLLAAPRLTTMNHERAWIESGQEIPFRNISVSATGISTFTIQFKQASIELEVTPHVIKNGPSQAIALDVVVGRKEADFAHAIEGNPPLISRTIYTRALVEEGETAVVGGLMREDTTNNVDKIPVLSDIPVLGWFFKRTEKKEDKSQLMVFLTPIVLPSPLSTADTIPAPAP